MVVRSIIHNSNSNFPKISFVSSSSPYKFKTVSELRKIFLYDNEYVLAFAISRKDFSSSLMGVKKCESSLLTEAPGTLHYN